MNEVTKLYENAGIEKLLYCDICKAQEHALGLCAETKCEPFYPSFTAEKQLELYKYLCKPFLITTRYYFDEFSLTAENTFEWKTMTKVSATGKTYEECIAKLVNNLWQDLTDTDKVQIKEILE